MTPEELVQRLNKNAGRHPLEIMHEAGVNTWRAMELAIAERNRSGRDVYYAEINGRIYQIKDDIQGCPYAEEVWIEDSAISSENSERQLRARLIWLAATIRRWCRFRPYLSNWWQLQMVTRQIDRSNKVIEKLKEERINGKHR